MQNTIKSSVTFTGTGLHSGRVVRMTIHPASAEYGIWFRRTDVEDRDAFVPARWDAVTDTRLNTRIGISAIMEDLQGSDALHGAVDRLGALTRHEDPHIRGDACHFLSLSGNRAAGDYIRPLLEDEDAGGRIHGVSEGLSRFRYLARQSSRTWDRNGLAI